MTSKRACARRKGDDGIKINPVLCPCFLPTLSAEVGTRRYWSRIPCGEGLGSGADCLASARWLFTCRVMLMQNCLCGFDLWL